MIKNSGSSGNGNVRWMAMMLGWRWVVIMAFVYSFCWVVAEIICMVDWRKERKLYKAYKKRRPEMFNVLKSFVEERLGTKFLEKGEVFYSPISDRINLESIYSAIVHFVKEIGYSADEISVGDGSHDERVELKIWKEKTVFRLKLYYAGNNMAVEFY